MTTGESGCLSWQDNDSLLNNAGNWILLDNGLVRDFLLNIWLVFELLSLWWLDVDDTELIWFDSLNISLSLSLVVGFWF